MVFPAVIRLRTAVTLATVHHYFAITGLHQAKLVRFAHVFRKLSAVSVPTIVGEPEAGAAVAFSSPQKAASAQLDPVAGHHPRLR